MKKLLLLIGIILTIQVSGQINYNLKKDVYINSVLDGGYIYATMEVRELSSDTKYTLMYEEFKIRLIHQHAVPYEQSEWWIYLVNDKNGNMIIIDGISREHKVSDKTINRIKQICLNANKK